MLVYRIVLKKWAGGLAASGRAARWNRQGRFVIYTAGSRALACLENLVHRNAIGNDDQFKIVTIHIPASLWFDEIPTTQLFPGWTSFANYPGCQSLGDEWLNASKTAVLKVPSAIIPDEFNYLLNPAHKDFGKIVIKAVEDFSFDGRLV